MLSSLCFQIVFFVVLPVCPSTIKAQDGSEERILVKQTLQPEELYFYLLILGSAYFQLKKVFCV